MVNSLFGLLLATGVGAWVYNYIYNRTGGNVQNALVMAAVAGAFAFVVFLTVLHFIPKGNL